MCSWNLPDVCIRPRALHALRLVRTYQANPSFLIVIMIILLNKAVYADIIQVNESVQHIFAMCV